MARYIWSAIYLAFGIKQPRNSSHINFQSNSVGMTLVFASKGRQSNCEVQAFGEAYDGAFFYF
uniref:Uncharacterized protein n=1 Tax=Leersia perrieri TaxID=77586 RepID=A0A0D9VKZ4_9ORYZ